MFDFLEDISPLIQKASSVLKKNMALRVACQCVIGKY